MKEPPALAGSPPPGGASEEEGGEKEEEGEKGGGEAQEAVGSSSSVGRRASASREPPERTMKPEGSDSAASESAPSDEAPPPAEVKVKTETPDDFAWPHGAEEPRKGTRGAAAGTPAEICVVLGGVRSPQTLGSYECGICGKKYKYYNCFQTHVRAHRDTEVASGEGASQGNNFRYTCDICGKKYKYYSCFQEHRDLHAVDDPYDQALVAKDEVKEEDPEPFQKIGPKTGSYTCEFCGKQYKYYTPYQEHVALHAPIKYSRSPLLVAVKTHAGKKAPAPAASIIRCSALLHRTPSGASQLQMFRAPNSGSPGSKATTESVFSRRVESKLQNNYDETNSSSQNSSEPYTCGACGIQFQFYNNLLEHMQSHAADNENSMASHQPRSPPPSAPEEKWKPPPVQQDDAESVLPSAAVLEKERQSIAERLLRLLCAEPAALSVVGGSEFLKLVQALVDSGARHGAFPAADSLGNLSTLALQQLPRMYNQAKVKVTCALGTGACRGIGVTCHAQGSGAEACHVLTAHRAEGGRIRSYVLAVRGAGDEPLHRWAQNVLSEFVTPETRAAYVTDGGAFAKAGLCLRCAACALNAAVRGVLSQRALQARGMPEVAELLGACQDLAGSPGAADEAFGAPAPPCWDSPADALLAVHERYEQICEFYGRGPEPNPAAGLNRPLLANLAALLAPVKQAVSELGAEGRPTLQLVLPTYVRLEKLFTAKAGDAGPVSKLCHLFLEALKENFKLHAAHKVAMVLDPRQKLRPVPPYQHEEIVAKVCQLLGLSDEAEAEPTAPKKPRAEAGPDETEVYGYLQEPLATAAQDLFQYWSGAQHPRLAKLAFWLLAVPAVGARSSCARLCEQALLIRRRRLLGPEDANKLIFLKANMP